MLFVETHYTLATEEAERIGVDHVARLSNTGTVDGSTGVCMTRKCIYVLKKKKIFIPRPPPPPPNRRGRCGHYPLENFLKISVYY